MAGSRNLTHAPGKPGRRPVVPRKTAPQRIFAFRPERTMPEALFAVRIDRRRKWRISAGSTGDESQRFRRDRLHQCTSRIEPMSMTGLEAFDKTIQTTNIWLDEIMEDLGPAAR